jgi:hypothetical protein
MQVMPAQSANRGKTCKISPQQAVAVVVVVAAVVAAAVVVVVVVRVRVHTMALTRQSRPTLMTRMNRPTPR